MMRRGASISRAPARGLTKVGCAATIALVLTAVWSVAGSGDAAAKSLAKPRPLNVAVRLAPDRLVHRTVGAQGATLVLNANGVRYRLVIPSGALATDVPVTMTPARSIGRLPFKRGIVGAVQLEPEGLQLAREGRLTITSRRNVPLTRQTAFAYLRAGKDFHLYPRTLSRRSFELPISHFSGYGEGNASPAEVASLERREPADLRARLEADLGAIVKELLDRQQDCADAAAQPGIGRALLPSFRLLVAQLKAAAADDGQLQKVITQALEFDHQLKLLGCRDAWGYDGNWWPIPFPLNAHGDLVPGVSWWGDLRREQTAAGRLFFWKVFENAFARAEQRCPSDHDPAQAARMEIIATWVQRLGGPNWTQRTVDAAAVCLRFRLEISSGAQLVWSDGISETESVQTTISLARGQGTAPIEGTGTATVTAATYLDPSDAGSSIYWLWTFIGSRPDSAWAQLFIDPNLKPDEAGNQTLEKAGPAIVKALWLKPGKPAARFEVGHYLEGELMSTEIREDSHNMSLWVHAHFKELYPGRGERPDLFKIENWTPGTGDVFAMRDYWPGEYPVGPFTVHEYGTTLTLYHTPGA